MNSLEQENSKTDVRKRKSLVVSLVLIGVMISAFLAAVFSLQRFLIYAQDKGPVPVALSDLPEGQIREVVIPSEKGIQLHGWFIEPGDSAKVSHEEAELVIIFPGNAGNRSYRMGTVNGFRHLGCHVLIVDYRGYAENAGKPTEEGLAHDARVIWDYAVNDLGFQSNRIIIYGESLGAAVATRLSWDLAHDEVIPAGLILCTPFTSLVDTAKYLYPWLPVSTFLLDRYPSIDRIQEIECPILVIHGTHDEIVPFDQGKALFEAAPESSSNGIQKRLLVLPEVGHNNIMAIAGAQVIAAEQDFLHAIREVKISGQSQTLQASPITQEPE